MSDKIKIKVSCKEGLSPVLPDYSTSGSAGADIRACLTAPMTIKAGERALIPTGLFFEIPPGFEIQVRPRSGLALKNGITCLNTPGTIDSDYRGEIGIILINTGKEDFTVENNDRIAQLVLAPVYQAEFEMTNSLSLTERGAGGFGSTGKN